MAELYNPVQARSSQLALMTGAGLFLFVFLKNAWVADDAYIAFRSVEQLFAGHGARWNIDERVQVFTSPLWFGLLSLLRIITSNLFLVAISLSALCCGAMLMFARRMIDDDLRWMLFVLLITGCWCVMDFSSSGLENSLLYALLSAFIYFYSRYALTTGEAQRNAYARVMLSAGLLLVGRHDMATLIVLPTLFVVVREWRATNLRAVLIPAVIAVLPLLCWSIFSVIYYGVPFPNTAYAKLLHGVARSDLVDFGKLYVEVSLKWDVFSELIFALLLARLIWKREAAVLFLALGVLLNLLYVVGVGGDFMQGRFVSEAVVFAALAIFTPATSVPNAFNPRLVLASGAALLVLMLAINSPLKLAPDSGFDIEEGHRHFSWRGILNERNFYFKTNSLWAYAHRDPSQPFPNHKWCQMGTRARVENKQSSDFGGIGMYGYCAGLGLVVIDNLALGEPFFARLPKTANKPWRAGHFHRDAPRGYLESRLSGENHIVDPQLAALWSDVHQMVNAPLFTVPRWQAIWRINTGTYRDIGPAYQADIAAQAGKMPENTEPDTISN